VVQPTPWPAARPWPSGWRSRATKGKLKTKTATIAFGLVLALAAPGMAQDYPSKPITIISAQASGGASDTVVRAVQERLQTALGQPIVMENRPGASGNVGAAAVARAAPDGTTLMVGTDAMMTSNVHLFKSMPFDPVKDFAPITNAGTNIIVLAVHADVPVKSVAELVSYAKANPGKVQFGTSGSPRRIISPASCSS
jgi:tripartite-type tricarboxylate transporter receptor subunit TctC